MADFELFNGTNLEEPDSDHRIAMNKPSLAGAFFIRWDNFKNLIRSFTVSKDTDQSISGNKTFTGIVNVQAPTSDNNPVTLKYFNDNAGGGEEIIEVETFVNLPLIGDASVIYVVLDENVLYRWSGTVYVSMSSPLSYASQAEMELSEPTENTKVVTPLRVWQGFVFWCKNTIFPELNTSDKTIIGAINELKTNVVKLETDETPAAIADTDNVRFKSATGWYNRTLLAIYELFVTKSVPPQELSDLLDTDAVFGARGTDARYWSFALVIQKLLGYLPKDTAYTASSWADVQAICESPTCPASVAIHLVSDVQMGNLTTYAKNIVFHGRQVTVSSLSSIISGAAGAGTYRVTFESGLSCYAAEPAITFGLSENVQDWDVRIRDLQGSVNTRTTLSVVKIAPSTCTFRYNSATNVVFAATNVTPAQINMWYELTSTEITTVVNVSDTPDTRYYIGNLPYGWLVESISAQAQLNSASFTYAFESITEDVYTQWTGTIALSGSIIFSLHGNFPTVSTQPVFGNGLLGQLNPVYVNSSPSTVKSIAVVPVAMANTITVFKLKIVKVI